MSTLAVGVAGRRVGILDYFEDEERYLFTLSDDWSNDPHRPILGQWFEDWAPSKRAHEFSGPPLWFSHLLPQGPLRRAILRAADLSALCEFELYELLGADLPGAVTLAPSTMSPLNRRRQGSQLSLITPKLAVWSAIAGMQMKMSVRRRERGLVVGVRGEERDMIAKFWSPDYLDLPRVEHATMCWASESGVDIPPCELMESPTIEGLPEGVPLGDQKVFVIERFDRRTGGLRVHFEDFAQVLSHLIDLGPRDFYHADCESIAAVLAALCPAELRTFVERLVFNVLAGNGDAHLKNWALLYPDGRTARLTPAYDLVSTVVYPAHLCDDELALALANTRRFDDVQVESFEPTARLCGVAFDELSRWVRAMTERVLDAWSRNEVRERYSPKEQGRIDQHISRVPLRRI